MCRMAFRLHCTAAMLEVTIIIVNILYLLSVQQEQGLEQTRDHIFRDVVTVALSTVLTMFSLVFNLIGAHKLLRALRSAWTRVQPAISQMRATTSQLFCVLCYLVCHAHLLVECLGASCWHYNVSRCVHVQVLMCVPCLSSACRKCIKPCCALTSTRLLMQLTYLAQ